MEMDDNRLKAILDNFVEKVYTKGDIKFYSRITHNDTWFAHKENRRATIYNIDLEVEMDKLFPLSENYDPTYSDKLKDAYKIENVKKYLGMDNLVMSIDFEWDSQENQNYSNEVIHPLWRKMTEETIDNMVNDKNIQDKIIPLKGSPITKEEFKDRLNFIIWEYIEYNEGELAIDVASHFITNKFNIDREIYEHARRTIDKYGLQDLDIYNDIGNLA